MRLIHAHYMIICHQGSPRLPPAVCLTERLVNDHPDCTLAVPRDCPCKINFVRGGKVENAKFLAVWTVVLQRKNMIISDIYQ